MSGLGRAGARLLGGVLGQVLGPALARIEFEIVKLRNRLSGASAVRPIVVLSDPWPGDGARGQAMLAGFFTAFGREIPFATGDWKPASAGPHLLALLHGFTWLRDLDAAGDPRSQAAMRHALADWLASERRLGRSGRVAWRPDILGQRVAMLLAWFGRLTEGDAGLERALLGSLAIQGAALSRTIGSAPTGASVFTALHGLIALEHCLPAPGRAGERRRERSIRLLETALDAQLSADGGQVERSPAIALEILRSLVDIRQVLRATRMPVPDRLQQSIDRIAPALRFFRHGDGGLALFNDSNEGDSGLIDLVLAQADAAGKPPRALPHIGFDRLVAKKTLVIFDAGAPALIDTHAHASTLALEVSIGKERLITNCGAHVSEGTTWRRAQRATAAHSSVTIDDTNSSEVIADGRLGRRARVLHRTRDENEYGTWVEARHDGYRERFGVIHQRRLYLAASGEDLRGEDALTFDPDTPQPIGGRYTLRFHLHPRVQASLAQDGNAVFLRLPSGSGWRLRLSGGMTSLADSIYLGQAGHMRRTTQILVQGAVSPEGTLIKWALQREGGPKR